MLRALLVALCWLAARGFAPTGWGASRRALAPPLAGLSKQQVGGGDAGFAVAGQPLESASGAPAEDGDAPAIDLDLDRARGGGGEDEEDEEEEDDDDDDDDDEAYDGFAHIDIEIEIEPEMVGKETIEIADVSAFKMVLEDVEQGWVLRAPADDDGECPKVTVPHPDPSAPAGTVVTVAQASVSDLYNLERYARGPERDRFILDLSLIHI